MTNPETPRETDIRDEAMSERERKIASAQHKFIAAVERWTRGLVSMVITGLATGFALLIWTVIAHALSGLDWFQSFVCAALVWVAVDTPPNTHMRLRRIERRLGIDDDQR